MHYTMMKRINSKAQQKEVPEHVSHTNEFQHFSQLKCNNSPTETLCPDVMNDLVKMSILAMKSKITYELRIAYEKSCFIVGLIQ